jgi:hypothetical protein
MVDLAWIGPAADGDGDEDVFLLYPVDDKCSQP